MRTSNVKRIFITILLMILILMPFTLSISQKEIKICVLPFLVDSSGQNIKNNFDLDLSKLITTKLYYSTTLDILSMKSTIKAMEKRKLIHIENINELELFLMGESLNLNYILIPRIKINDDVYKLEGSLYDVEKRRTITKSIIKGTNLKYIYNDIDKYVEELFDNIVSFNEKQPILRPAKINNIDLALYFDLDNSEFEFIELKNNFTKLLNSLTNITLGDNTRIAIIYSKKIDNIDKYIIKEFNQVGSIQEIDLDIINNAAHLKFLNSPIDNLSDAINCLNWSERKNNKRNLLVFTKKKIHNNAKEFSNFLSNKYVNCIYFILENTKKEVIEYNANVIALNNGVSVPLSYIMKISNEYPISTEYILKNNSIYKKNGIYDNSNKENISIDYLVDYNLKLLSYDFFVHNLQKAIEFLHVSGYSKENDLDNVKLNTNISNLIIKAIKLLYRKDFEEFKTIIIYNNSIIKKVPVPLYVAEKLISKVKEGDSFLLGAKILVSDCSTHFEIDPFSLIVPLHLDYIPTNLIIKKFADVSKHPEYYNQNGILNHNIWFFNVKLIKIEN